MVLAAGIIFNLTIQILYVWTLLKDKIKMPLNEAGWGWTSQQAGLPYTLGIIFFALGVLIGGRIQDKIGPRIVASFGGAMVGLGLIISGLSGNNLPGVAIGYGAVSGLGIGFGYGSVLPASLKWFHSSKKGLIGGLVLGGFGLASVHYAFITSALLDKFTIRDTMLYMGFAVAVISVIAAQFIKNPASDFIPGMPEKSKVATISKNPAIDFNRKDMLKTKRFYMIFILFLFSASVGLMILGNVVRIAEVQTGIGVSNAVFFISTAAIMNAAGRVVGGSLSDKIGRVNTLFIAIILQMFNMIGFIFYNNFTFITFGFILAGLCFGAFLAVFPAVTADQYGLKNYGFNYGIVYLAYGCAGIAAPVIADLFYDVSGDFNTAYIICACIMVLMIILNFILKRELSPKKYE